MEKMENGSLLRRDVRGAYNQKQNFQILEAEEYLVKSNTEGSCSKDFKCLGFVAVQCATKCITGYGGIGRKRVCGLSK